jgi:chromosome segregation ATPase
MTDAKLEIPDAIATALGDWVRQMADEASAGPRAAQARSEEELQAARDELSVSAARDQAQALAAERNEEIEQLMAELRNARSIATDALVGKAKDQLAIEGKDAQPADLRAQIERNVAATAALSDARPGGRDGAGGAVTARDNYAAEIKELRARLATRMAARESLSPAVADAGRVAACAVSCFPCCCPWPAMPMH